MSGHFQLGHAKYLADLELAAAGGLGFVTRVSAGVKVFVWRTVTDRGLSARTFEVTPTIQRVSVKTVTLRAREGATRSFCRWRCLLCDGLSGRLDRGLGWDRGCGKSNWVAVHILGQIADFGVFVKVQTGWTALAECSAIAAVIEARAALRVRIPTQTRVVSASCDKTALFRVPSMSF